HCFANCSKVFFAWGSLQETACRSQPSAFSRYWSARDWIEASLYRTNGRGVRLFRAQQCPLWVKSGHWGNATACPLYPQKRTIAVRRPDQLGRASVFGIERTRSTS